MNIILQNYNDLLKKIIFETFSSNLKEKLNKIDSSGNVMNYINLLSNLDESLCIIARESLISIFEAMDKSFRLSSERKRKYIVKSNHSRTIMTIFGEITFNRTFYVSKLNNKSYCYVDRVLGLHKYDYFDPYLKALIVEYSANNSYQKVANYINDLIGNRIKIKSSFNYLSRQTIRNIILASLVSKPKHEEIETPEILYIIADEKFIHTQNNNKKDVMEKSIVVFEKIINKKLVNKQIFASVDHSYLHNCLDYIYEVYDVDKIKTIYVMGDGASWIKNLRESFRFNNAVNIIYALDKFHFKQSLHHIALDKNLENILESYVINNNRTAFKECCEELIKSFPHRKETITNKEKYILNNITGIIAMYKNNLSCPMESQISHNIADFFSARPKGYAVKTIEKLTELRLLFKNNYNIKELYLNNFNNNEILTIDKDVFNFNIFEKKETYSLVTKKDFLTNSAI